jgi:NitT/TauT family transport system substrate-binding protein
MRIDKQTRRIVVVAATMSLVLGACGGGGGEGDEEATADGVTALTVSTSVPSTISTFSSRKPAHRAH